MSSRGLSKATGERLYTNRCKKCSSARRDLARKANKSPVREASNKRRQDTFRMNNKEKLKDKYLRYGYGITLQDYNELLEAQGGGCGICGVLVDRVGRMLAVDHNHNTGKVRGILCSDCNTALGLLKDSPELLSKAITYLVKQN